MAGKSATLTVKIVSDAKGAAAGFADAESRVDKFQSGLNKASVAAGGLLVGLGGVAKQAFDSASALQQATGAIDATFGESAGRMRKLAQNAAQSVGLSQTAYSENASVLGSQLKNMGVAADDLLPHTNALISRGADLAAQFGGSTSDAVEALSSLLRGERDPIERYGISINQAGIDAKVASMGLDTSSEAAKKNSQYLATLALVSQQTAAANGAFARESDTAAGAQQRATAQFENAKAALGEVLLPIVAAAATKFSEFTTFLVANKDTVIPLVAVLAVLAATVLTVNAAVATFTAITTAWTVAVNVAKAAQFLWNLAMAANPIGFVVTLIAALVAAVVLAYNKFSWFRDIVQSVWEWLKKAWDFAGKVVGIVGDFFSSSPAMAVQVTPVAGDAAGLFGAASSGSGAWAPIRGAALSPSSGGTSPSAGRGPANATVVNITVNGALDAQSVADQIAGLLRRRDIAQGSTPVVVL